MQKSGKRKRKENVGDGVVAGKKARLGDTKGKQKMHVKEKGKRKERINAEKGKKGAVGLEESLEKISVQEDNRILIVDRLNAKDPRPALEELTGSSDEKDLVEEFFSSGGQVNTLLKVLQLREDKVKANDVAAVFSACQTVIKRVVRSENPSLSFGGRGLSFAVELTKRILDDYGKEITLLLSPQNTNLQAKSVLRLLTSMVTLGVSCSKLLLLKIEWDNPNWENLPKRTSRKEDPDVRTCYIHFLLSFLMEPSQLVLKEYFERKTRLFSIFPGLMQDPADTVQLVLQTFRCKILENVGVSKTYKMRLFGAHNLKPLLALFHWKGPKVGGGEEDEEALKEDLDEVKNSLMEFLRVLLASVKFGVVFQDPEYGCEKTGNPLLAEVLSQLSKPWESTDLARITGEILSTSPGEIRPYLDTLRSDWKPRRSGVWGQLMDFFYVVFSNIRAKHIAETFKNTNRVGNHILRTIMLPMSLLEEVLIPGLSMEDETVSRQSLEVLHVLLRNTEVFLQGAQKQALEKELRFVLKDRFPGVDVLTAVWTRELHSPSQKYIPHILSVITFHTRYCSGWGSCVDIIQILRDLERVQFSDTAQSTEAGLNPKIQTLRIITDILDSEKHLSTFVTRFLSEDAFSTLLNCVGSGDANVDKDEMDDQDNEEQERDMSVKAEAGSILERIAEQTKICLPDLTDLKLLLALGLSTDLVPELGRILMRSVRNQSQLEEEIQGYQTYSLTQGRIDEILDSLMEDQALDFPQTPCSSPGLSPLLLCLLEADLQLQPVLLLYVEQLLECLLLSTQDRASLCLAISGKLHLFSKSFAKKVELLTAKREKGGKSKLPNFVTFLNEENARKSAVLSEVYCAKLVLLCTQDGDRVNELGNFLNKFTDIECAQLVQKMFDEKIFENFSPFRNEGSSKLVLFLLAYVKKFNLPAEKLIARVLEATSSEIDAESKEDFVQENIMQTFSSLRIPGTELIQLLSKVTNAAVTSLMDKNGRMNKQGYILSALLNSLGNTSCPESSFPAPVIGQLSSHLEFVLQLSGEDDILKCFFAFLRQHTALCDRLSGNLFYVCVEGLARQEKREIVSVFIKHSVKMFQCFRDWLVASVSKDDMDALSLLNLVHSLIEQGLVDVLLEDKKIVRCMLRVVLSVLSLQLRTLENPEFSGISTSCLLILQTLRPVLSSSKSVSSLQAFFTEAKETLKRVKSEEGGLELGTRSTLIQLNHLVLKVLEAAHGSFKKDLLNFVLIPCVEFVKDTLGAGVLTVPAHLRAVSEVAAETCLNQTSSAVRNYLNKNKSQWSAFIKGVLKYGMKNEEIGVPCINFLSSLCRSKYSGVGEEENQETGDREEMNLVVDMLTSHSGYIPLLMGGSSKLKVCVLELLGALAPASCTQEQLAPLLSGYTGTLSPADRCTLKLLCTMERYGVNLSVHKPLMFGKQAVKQFSAQQTGKTNKVSECLSALNPDLVSRTIERFPLSLNLDPTQECELSPEDESLYDPRFLLPYLSALTGTDMFIDRHMKLVESGALGLAIAALSSKDTDIRSMGYHLLHRFYLRMNEAKLVSEKQVWTHLVNLVKHGLTQASENKVCLKLPTITTLFLARCIPILSNPTHFMYNAISGFLLAKPVLNLYSVPEFLRLFHSKEVDSHQQQTWILHLLRDGLRERLDHQMFVQFYVYKLILSNFGSCLSDRSIQGLVLEILERASRLPVAGYDLVSNYGVVQWISVVSAQMTDRRMCTRVLDIVQNLSAALTLAEIKKESGPALKPRTTLKNILRSGFFNIQKNFESKFSDVDFLERLRNISCSLQ